MLQPSFLRNADWLTRERIFRIAWIFAMFSVAVLLWSIWDHTRMGLTNPQGEQLGTDFINYWSGAHLAANGQSGLVYDIDAFVRFERAHTSANASFRWYAYPPVTMLLTLPLALFSFVPALILWTLCGFALSAFLLSRSVDWRTACLAAIATPATLVNTIAGQNGQLSAALLAGGILLLEKRPLIAGFLFGALCYKPQLAILLPFALAAGRYWRAFFGAMASVIALITSSVLLFGWQTWAAFGKTAPLNRLLMEHGDSFWHRMPSVFAAARLIGMSSAPAYVLQILSAVIAAILVVLVWRSSASLGVKGAALIIGSFLSTPYAWDYDMVALTFAVVWLGAEAARTGFRPWQKIVLAATLTAPIVISPLAIATHLQSGPIILWLAMIGVAQFALSPDKSLSGTISNCVPNASKVSHLP